jgi:23S rRNA (guanine1835-N2)-methyltransferase
MIPFTKTQIKRYPFRKNDTLLGQDSADDLILEHLKEVNLSEKRILIINDQFGALSCGLDKYSCTSYTDSYLSFMGILTNGQKKIRPINRLENLDGFYDYVLIQIPKNMSFFEDILCHLTEHLHAQSKLICGAMIKHLAPKSFDLIQKYIGKTRTSLAKKKARLIFADFEKEQTSSHFPLVVKLEMFDTPFINPSNLFSREKLDIGTRFFLEHIPQGPFKKILDLGCANGVIGIKAKMINPDSTILFSDESSMAIESAQINYNNHFKEKAEFFWTNCFENQEKEFIDLVLCNPPFHQGNTIGDYTANQMFQDAFVALKVGGKIRVIGNSHLGYQIKIKKIFGNSQIIATNNKFIICEAYKK